MSVRNLKTLSLKCYFVSGVSNMKVLGDLIDKELIYKVNKVKYVETHYIHFTNKKAPY